VDVYEPLSDRLHREKDSLMELFYSTKDNMYYQQAELLPIRSTDEAHARQQQEEFEKLIALGYGDPTLYKDTQRFRFALRSESFTGKKISTRAVSPDDLEKQYMNPKGNKKLRQTTKELLRIFQ